MLRVSSFRFCVVSAVFLAAVAPASAQNFTTAAEVKPILSATKPQWIAVREYEGRDLLYFSNLLAWRCGVTSVSYGVNGAAPETPLTIEPCYDSEAQPNALKMDQGVLPYIEAELGSLQTITVLVTYDDGSSETGEYQRAAVMTP